LQSLSARHGASWRATIRELAPVATLAALVAFFSAVAPGFWRTNTIISIFDQGAALAIVATGLTFVLLCAEIDLAVGNLATWASCLCGWLFASRWLAPVEGETLGWGALVAVIVIPLATSLLFGALSGALTVWSRLPSFIITLAMMNVAMGLSKLITHNQSLRVPVALEKLGNGAIALGGQWRLPYGVLLAAAIMLVAHLVLAHTRFGRYVYMTGGNREAARLAGISTGMVVVACLAISGLTAGIGGLVNAGRLQSASVLLNADLLLNAVACVVLGGTSLFGGEGSVPRTLVGVLTFRVLEVGLQRIDWIDEDARLLLTGCVLLAALVINGLLARGRGR
jgi:ribose transport system permease protein